MGKLGWSVFYTSECVLRQGVRYSDHLSLTGIIFWVPSFGFTQKIYNSLNTLRGIEYAPAPFTPIFKWLLLGHKMCFWHLVWVIKWKNWHMNAKKINLVELQCKCVRQDTQKIGPILGFPAVEQSKEFLKFLNFKKPTTCFYPKLIFF